MMRRRQFKTVTHILPEVSLVLTGDGVSSPGVVAARGFWPGDYILKFGGPLLTRDRVEDPSYVLTIGDNVYLGPSGELDDRVNHSCEPNSRVVVMDVEDGIATLVATSVIRRGEEITFDYATTLERDDEWTMVCKCQTPTCRGIIQAPR